ncbi:hypothetical protein D9M68_947030 [compost metagenome]
MLKMLNSGLLLMAVALAAAVSFVSFLFVKPASLPSFFAVSAGVAVTVVSLTVKAKVLLIFSKIPTTSSF